MKYEINFLLEYDAESIIADLKRVAALLGKDTVSAVDIDTHGRAKYHAVVRQFGSLRKALEAAGLKLSRCNGATAAELLKMLADLWDATLRESNRRPRTADLVKYNVPVSVVTIVKRFGSWKKALVATSAAENGGKTPEGFTPVVSQRRVIPVAKRFLVLKRDRYRCRICNRSGVELEVDHIVPVSQGGTDRLDNLQTACRECNRGKGGRLE
jgi:hypothetical protein